MKRCVRCFCELTELTVFCPQCAMPHEPDFDVLLQRRLHDRYQIYRRLGAGGLSTVYAATDTRTDQIVVVKISDPRQLVRRATQENMASAEQMTTLRRYWSEMLERMRRETAALAVISHPHIVRIFDTDIISEDLRYIVMEMLHGKTLRDDLNVRRRYSVSETIQIASQIIEGLQILHTRGIIHRDLNPRNLFLSEPGQAASEAQAQAFNPQLRIIDFGISRFPQPQGTPQFTQYAVLSGTVSYASPEQCQGLALDHRTDIYSLGVTLYEMVTGQKPFTGRTPTEIALRQIQSVPVHPRRIVPSLPEEFAETILRAMSKEPENRFQNVAEFSAALQRTGHSSLPRFVIPLEMEKADSLLTSEFPRISTDPAPEPEPKTADQSDIETVADTKVMASVLEFPERKRKRMSAAAATIALVGLAAAAGYLWRNPSRLSSIPVISPLLNSPAAKTFEPLTAGQIASIQTTEKRTTATPAVFVPWTTPGAFSGFSQIRTSGNATGAQSISSVNSTRPSVPAPVMPSAITGQFPAPIVTSAPDAARDPQIIQSPDEIRGPMRAHEKPTTQEPVNQNGSAAEGKTEMPVRVTSLPRENPGGENTESSPASAEADIAAHSPKVISWSGDVNEEREIRLELPGVPGNINIPRAYRNRVGLVEPPSPGNNWSCVVLRVFGKGKTSIVVQWWPGRQFTRSAGGFVNRNLVERIGSVTRFTSQQFSRFKR